MMHAGALCLLLAASNFGTVPLGLDALRPTPEDNPLTPEKAALGRKLFFDTRLSRDNSLSCASCHDPKRAFTDGRPVAVGVFGRKGNRRVPTLLNRAYGKAFFWDGRAATLEEQVVLPIVNEKEMDLTMDEAVTRVREGYGEAFQRVFGRPANADDLARALATYVRTILSGDSPYDRYVGGDREALSEEARTGLRLFRGKANCVVCHLGPNLTDERFHNTGIGGLDDPGRYAITKQEPDRGAFKTPTLREAAGTGPYMHNGSIATLEKVIEEYDKGGKASPSLDPEMRPLKLTDAEKKALLAFLKALSGKIREGN
ncbi:MAG: cytochrome c peroxidase [Bryobacteraceae bacterium]